MNSLWISEMGLKVNEKMMEVISSNISNINTNAYKFQEVFLEEIQNHENERSNFSGVKVSGVYKRFSQGDLINTNNMFDFAIEGKGFFRVLLPDEKIGYTRNGEFIIDGDGYLRTKSGYKLFPEIVVPEDIVEFKINEIGDCIVKKSNGEIEAIGEIELADFISMNSLKSIGQGIYVTDENFNTPIINKAGKNGFGVIRQGFLEKSNVDLINEFMKMIITQKAYEINAKVIQTTDAMMQIANSIKR